MDHWFDELTKGLASAEPSRRTVIAGIGATLAATRSRWSTALAATKAGTKPYVVPVKTATFGACTLYSKGSHYEHHLVSKASASGHTAELHKSRTIDPKTGTTIDTTILVDGKTQLQLTGTYKNASRSEKMVIGDAFGISGAVLTSDDGGKMLRGTVGGKTIKPYETSSGKKLQFVNGQPKRGQAVPGVNDAIKAVLSQGQADYQRCTSSAHASLERNEHLALDPYRGRHNDHLERTQETSCGTSSPSQYVSGTTLTCAEYTKIEAEAAKNGAGYSISSTNPYFTTLCEACNNKCGGNLLSEIGNFFECVGSIAEYCTNGCDKCKDFVDYSGVQFNCQQGCNAGGQACNPVPCGSPDSCSHDQVCVYQGNYNQTFGYNTIPAMCCPKSHPQACGNPQAYYGTANYYCCNAQSPCLYDTRFGAAGSYSSAFGFYCCPTPRVCGKREKGVWVGECCAYGQTCCGSTCCSPGQVCAHQAPVHLAIKNDPNHLSTPGGAPVCCAVHLVKDGQCCQSGHWCGDQCCGTAATFGCPGGKCPPQPTLCLTGVHCGFTCCETGCANAKTSTCKKTSKCSSPHYECLTFPEMGVTSVCCPKGVTCAGGKCCPKGTKACQHVTTGVIGCWPHSQCAPPLPPPK